MSDDRERDAKKGKPPGEGARSPPSADGEHERGEDTGDSGEELAWLRVEPAADRRVAAAAKMPGNVLPLEPGEPTGRESKPPAPKRVPEPAAPPTPARAAAWGTPAASAPVLPSPSRGDATAPSERPAPAAPPPERPPTPPPGPPTAERERPTAPQAERADRVAQVAAEVAAAQAAAESSRAQQRRDYEAVAHSVQLHVKRGSSLLGLVGLAGSGKTHFLRGLSMLLKRQGFETPAWASLRRALVPGRTEALVFDYACTGPNGEKWAFVDAGGELYARIRDNNWKISPEESAALLHSLHHCRGLFLFLHLQPGHFRGGAIGAHRWSTAKEQQIDARSQAAQEELEFFDYVLLFLRALKKEKGDVAKLMRACAAAPNIDKALREYRDESPQLDIPVVMLFTQADTFEDSGLELAEGSFLSPRQGTVNVAAFAARFLPDLYGSLARHVSRFKFDFVQSYEEVLRIASEGDSPLLPVWESGGELLSAGALPALEFLVRELPARGPLRQLLRRFVETRHAMAIDRWLHRRRWRGVKVS